MDTLTLHATISPTDDGQGEEALSVPFVVRLCLQTDASLRLATSAVELRVA